MMSDYKINLLDSAGPTVSSLDPACDDDRKSFHLGQCMPDGGGHADIWTGVWCVGDVPEACGTDVEALGPPWASQPFNRA